MLDYSEGKGELENWLISETRFSPDELGKCEAIMYLGNGYMGLRSAMEEPYLQEKRNLFVSGTFNRSQENEVTELPNLADVIRLDIRVDGERFSLEFGETSGYLRQLNLKTAELCRSFIWTSPQGKILRFHFRRFVSLENLHLIAMNMEVESLSDSVHFAFDSGINAQMTNSGSQHFLEDERRVFEKRFLQLIQKTSESDIDIIHNTTHQFKLNGQPVNLDPDMNMERRKVWLSYSTVLQKNDILTLEKLATVHTSRDKENEHDGYELEKLRKNSLNELKQHAAIGYDELFVLHQQAWKEKVWDLYGFELDSEKGFDELAIRFSLYHLTIMAPAHDDRMGIAAKALSGEGYKGHAFWDTEIFILPFFIFSNSSVARSLLLYRYHGLAGARQKAEVHGYAGAMYPWEMAWPTDGETTPEWGDIDIVTGNQSKIWSGLIEQHISADIAFAVYQYFQVTNDQAFMEDFGCEMVFETANFWASRFEWNEQKERYEITDVIGPDEYKEHVSNNAFTNYMAYFNLKLAIDYYRILSEINPRLLERLSKRLGLNQAVRQWQSKSGKLYLPDPRLEDLVIPQDDTYFGLKEIDLAKYKNQTKVRTIYRDYNSEQINGIQVTKQADVLILLYLLDQSFLHEDERFSMEVKRANFDFYEPRTLHDSSLSLATHAVLANDLGYTDLAYSLFRQCTEIDLGPKMDTSTEGIHAAAIGGIWKTAAFGFAGIRLAAEKLTINPKLPESWHRIKFTIIWQGQPLHLSITKDSLSVTASSQKKVTFETFGKLIECEGFIEIPIAAAN